MAFVVLMWVSVLSVIVAADLPGLGMAAAVGVGWLLLRFLPGLADVPAVPSDQPGGGFGRDERSGRGGPAASIEPARPPHQRYPLVRTGSTSTGKEPVIEKG